MRIGRVGFGTPLSRGRVFHIAQSIPDQAACVELVVQDTGASSRIAVDRRRTPRGTARPTNAFAIQGLGNGSWRDAIGIELMNPADYFRFGHVNAPGPGIS